jgi:hypothetical protein
MTHKTKKDNNKKQTQDIYTFKKLINNSGAKHKEKS